MRASEKRRWSHEWTECGCVVTAFLGWGASAPCMRRWKKPSEARTREEKELRHTRLCGNNEIINMHGCTRTIMWDKPCKVAVVCFSMITEDWRCSFWMLDALSSFEHNIQFFRFTNISCILFWKEGVVLYFCSFFHACFNLFVPHRYHWNGWVTISAKQVQHNWRKKFSKLCISQQMFMVQICRN